MKLILRDNERALLFRHGVYKGLLGPGKHRIRLWLGETAYKMLAEGPVVPGTTSLSVLLDDAAFAKSVACIDVPDGQLAVHFVDGRVTAVLCPGRYAFWNIFSRNTFELVDVTDPQSAGALPVLYMDHMPAQYVTRHDVAEGEAGLLFYSGVYQRTLPPGQHYFWNYNTTVTVRTVETRVQQLDISGQEILTADKVSLRINFVCAFQVADPVRAVTELRDYREQLYVLAQLALRELAGRYRFDELLRQKDSLGGQVLERLREREGALYVRFRDAGVKDIILPGEIRDIMNTVLVAEKSAQASVITRREETAATKSLLDTARLMDENATLMKLKELEYLERICDKVGSISVGGGGSILQGLRDLISGK